MNYKYFLTNVVCVWRMDYTKCRTLYDPVGIVVLDAIIFSHCFCSGVFVYIMFTFDILVISVLQFPTGQSFMQNQIIASHTCFDGHIDVNC